jgi:hypothetical protein
VSTPPPPPPSKKEKGPVHSLIEGLAGAVPVLSSASATRPQSPHAVMAVGEVALVVDSHRLPSSRWPQSRYVATSAWGVGGKKRVPICEALQLSVYELRFSPFCRRSVAILDPIFRIPT